MIRWDRLWSDLTGFNPVHLGQRIVSLAVIWPFINSCRDDIYVEASFVPSHQHTTCKAPPPVAPVPKLIRPLEWRPTRPNWSPTCAH